MTPAWTIRFRWLKRRQLWRALQSAAINLGIARAQYEHAIAMLVGKQASTFSIPVEPKTSAPPPIPIGLPSQLLERRPDVAAAERSMAAANAQIGVAYAAYYPALTLSGNGGVESSAIKNLLDASSRFWSVGPSVSETVYDGGLRRATVNQYIATYNADLAAYRQSVLNAFQQVEDALAGGSHFVAADSAPAGSRRLRADFSETRTSAIRYGHRSLYRCGYSANHVALKPAGSGESANSGDDSVGSTD